MDNMEKLGGMESGVCGEADPEDMSSFGEILRPPLRRIDKLCKAPCMLTRYTIARMAFVGFMIAFGMRCNMSAAKNTLNGQTSMNWLGSVAGHVDSAYYWGFLISQIPGGFIATKYPASKIFGLSIVSSASLNLLLPFAMTLFHGHLMICLSMLQGLIEGVSFSACLGIWRFWAPPMERTRLVTLSFSGSYAGLFVGLLLSGILANSFGYQAPFYVYGVFGIIWYLVWLWLSFEKPRDHPAISIPELNYIEKSLGESSINRSKNAAIPWRKILSSLPVYAIIVSNCCRYWNFYLLVMYQSVFLNHRFAFRAEETGFVNALPFLILTAVVPLGGMLADLLRQKNIFSTTNVRKLFSCCGFGIEGVCFLFVAHATTATGALIALTCSVAFSGLATSGYNVNYLDIAPRYASILMGLSNGIGVLTGIIVPFVMDGLIQQNPAGCWTTVFTLSACVNLVGVIFYGTFASGDLQPWAEPSLEQVNGQRLKDNPDTKLTSNN